MLECKTGGAQVTNPDPLEAAKFREQFHAQYCVMVGPGWGEEAELGSELQTHVASAWTADDLTRLIAVQAHPYEMIALFAPGFAHDATDTLLWNRVHGTTKRLSIICDYLRAAGWNALVAAAKQGAPAEAPHLTVDAAMLLVDQRLTDAGSQALCDRAEVQLAFEYLTNPLVDAAVWTDSTRTATAITSA